MKQPRRAFIIVTALVSLFCVALIGPRNQVAAGNTLSEDDQWRKLELVVETARKIWG